ncbi:MAG: hypothetical protein U5R49_26240 [Deltaproteobacteria bacterium]|nr:hypothetical protein [Deltaproteobacteria bacterium]
MAFRIEQACTQCGAPIEIDETDRLIACPYCGVKSFLYTPDCFRYVLPHNAPGQDLAYVPYLRLKGTVFVCGPRKVHYRIVDITHLSAPFERFPGSLGLRPQAMKMTFMGPHIEGVLLKSVVQRSRLLVRAAKQAAARMAADPFHTAYLGETFNLIYLPLYVKGDILFDGITNKRLGRISNPQESFKTLSDTSPRSAPTFLATLCPDCGWNLEGQRDSVVLTCSNCETAWEASKGRLVKMTIAAARGSADDSWHFPFWQVTVRSEGAKLASYADFIRLTHQPKVIQPAWEQQDMAFFSPAFKIRPKVFLYLSRQLTLSQGDIEIDGAFPGKRLHPVTFPLGEAIQGIKVTLGASAMNKRRLMPRLPEIRFAIKDAVLVYLPFRESTHEMIQQEMNVGINKNALAFGRYL